MRKIVLVLVVLLSVIILTGCGNKVDVVPGIINVVYENPKYVDGSFYIDTHITNGLDEDRYIGSVDFGIYPSGDETEIAGAGFDINETVKAGEYISIELEFTEEYVFVSETDLLALGFTVEELELFFWIE